MKTHQPVWPIGLGLLALYFLAAVIEPADGAELYVAGDSAHVIQHAPCTYNGTKAQWCRWDRTEYSPIVASLEMGVSREWRTIIVEAFIQHRSLPLVPDKGENSIGIRVRATIFQWRAQ